MGQEGGSQDGQPFGRCGPCREPADLELSTRISIALRLAKSITIDEKTGESVGLRGFDCSTCSERYQRVRGCRLQGRSFIAVSPHSVDYHKPSRRSLDEILFCPASIPGILSLQAEVYDCIDIKGHGGLREYYDKPTAQLPSALVALYGQVNDAIDRMSAEVRAAYRRSPEEEG